MKNLIIPFDHSEPELVFVAGTPENEPILFGDVQPAIPCGTRYHRIVLMVVLVFA